MKQFIVNLFNWFNVIESLRFPWFWFFLFTFTMWISHSCFLVKVHYISTHFVNLTNAQKTHKHNKRIRNTNAIPSSRYQNQTAVSLWLFPHILCFSLLTIYNGRIHHNNDCSPNHCLGINRSIVQNSNTLSENQSKEFGQMLDRISDFEFDSIDPTYWVKLELKNLMNLF